MTRAVFLALLSHWKHRPFQCFTLILGLALATALWSGVQAINAEARASYARAADVLGRDVHRIESADGKGLTAEDYAQLRRLGWPVSPVLEFKIFNRERPC